LTTGRRFFKKFGVEAYLYDRVQPDLAGSFMCLCKETFFTSCTNKLAYDRVFQVPEQIFVLKAGLLRPLHLQPQLWAHSSGTEDPSSNPDSA
jgi:hypothetical protein